MKIKVAILGTGASSYFAAKTLLEDSNVGFELTVIDFAQNKEDKFINKKIDLPNEKTDHPSSFVLNVPPIFRVNSFLANDFAGSAAFGGLSEIWGATILRLSERELNNSTVNRSEIVSAWEYVENHLKENNSENSESYQQAAYRTLPKFVNQGIDKSDCSVLQSSNLAIRKISQQSNYGCIQCGKCLTGCEFGHIWTPSPNWIKLIKDNELKLKFMPGFWVKSISEFENKVSIDLISKIGKEYKLEFDHVFVGLGTIQTAALLLRSNIAISPITINDSQMLLCAFRLKLFRRTGTVETRISLADGFIYYPNRVDGQKLTENFYAQLYGYSKSLEQQIVKQIYLFKFIPKFFLRQILQRIGIAMCFFDQDLSGKVEVSMRNDSVLVRPIRNQIKKHYLINFAKKYFKAHGLTLMGIGAVKSPVGMGYHLGSSFPSSAQPENEKNYSDYLGRPNGMKRIFIVDSSIFHRTTSTPPTFNSMAISRTIALNFIRSFNQNEF